MIAVAEATPLHYLVIIGHSGVLPRLDFCGPLRCRHGADLLTDVPSVLSLARSGVSQKTRSKRSI